MANICFIILNWNGLGNTKKCIDSLFKSDKDFDVYLLDNGSVKDEFGILEQEYGKESRLILLNSDTNLGFTGGVNLCLKEAKKTGYSWYCLLNNDTIVDTVFLEKLITLIRNIPDKIGIFGPRIVHANKPEVIQSDGGNISLWTGLCPGINQGGKNIPSSSEYFKITDYVSGCCFFIRGSLLEEIGLLDDSFFAYYEEVDFCLRARQKGYDIGVYPSISIHHDQSSSSNKYTGLGTFLMMRNRMLLLKKHSNSLQYVFSFLYLLLYGVYFRIKYGPLIFFYFKEGTIEGILGKHGNPFLSHNPEFFLKKITSDN